MLCHDAGGAETLFIFEVVRNDRRSGLERVTRRRAGVGADHRVADHAATPADTRDDQQIAMLGPVFQDLGKVCSHPFRCRHDRIVEQSIAR